MTVSSACALADCDMSVDLGNGIELSFVLIDELDDPLGRYSLDHAFYMMTTEVTEGMFQNCQDMTQDGQSTSYGDGMKYHTYYVNWLPHVAHFADTLSIAQKENRML